MMTDDTIPARQPGTTPPAAPSRDAVFATLGALESRRDYAGALACVDEALAIMPRDPKLKLRRGMILRQLGQHDDSVAQLERLAKERPDDLSAKHELSVSLRFAGDCARSLALSDEILCANPTHRAALFGRLYTHLHAQDFPAAIEAARDLRARLPDDGEALLRHARALRLAGQPDAARLEIEGALLGGPRLVMNADTERRLRLEQARALLEAQQIRKAADVVADLAEAFPNERDVLVQAQAQARAALDPDAVLDATERALRLWPDDPRFVRDRILALIALGDLVAAEEALDTLPVPDAELRVRLLVEWRRFDEARAQLSALPEKQALHRDRLTAQILQAEGRPGAAFSLLDARYRKRPLPELAPQLLGLLVGLHRPDEARAFADALPDSVAESSACLLARSEILRLEGDVDGCCAMLAQAATDTTRSLHVVRRMVSTAVQWGIGTSRSRQILAALDRLIAELALALPDRTLALLRLHRAFGLGDWQAVLTLTDTACARAPRDLTLAAMQARALAETGAIERAAEHCDRILRHWPTMGPIIELRLALHIVQGKPQDGADFLCNALLHDHIALTLRLANHLQFTGRTEVLRAVVARDCAREADEAPRWLRALSDTLNGTDTAGPPEHPSYPVPEPLSPEETAALVDTETSLLAGPDLFLAEAATLWRLQGKPANLQRSWMRHATRATHAFRTVIARSALPEARLPLRETPELRALVDRLERREPSLLVSTHASPPGSITLAPHLPNLTYLMQDGPRQPELEQRFRAILAVRGTPAARIVKELRTGNSVMSTPDFPAEMRWNAQDVSAATGTLFGQECHLVDTVPKLAHGMKVPVYWIQQRLSKTGIVVDIRRMSDPAPDEPLAAWLGRWTQEYLDLVAGILTSDPRNQNLTGPLTRYLAARGARLP
ncbi:tetratricopeptide repeat protein [Pararhodobacter marinus]|uniref:tetratricopeptide repeat protein n=1 Tax=Pararhodobacter marinus TaxID=2184063 RepID=UPI00351888E8